jgi:hypothetical protein
VDAGEASVPRIRRTKTKYRQHLNGKFDAGDMGVSILFFLKQFVILLSIF